MDNENTREELIPADMMMGWGKQRTSSIVQEIIAFAEPLCRAEGLELVHVEYRRESGGRTLRLYIDKPGGVLLDDCANVSRQVSDYLDISDKLDERYNLEVSSPGSMRPLSRIADFDRFKGRQAKLKTAVPIEGRRNFTGCLKGVANRSIQLETDQGVTVIPIDQLTKAHLIADL